MNIVVCLKRVPDPEAPPSQFSVDATAQKLVPARSVPMLTSPYDESAVEAALQLREKHGGKITLLSLSGDDVCEWLQDALATGSDEAILVRDPELASGDGISTAEVLAAAAKKIGDYDLIICGRQAADTDAGVVGPAMAEFLGLPSASVVRRINVEGGALQLERVIEDGYEVLEMQLPAVLTITSEIYQLRYATLSNIMDASMKEVAVWSNADLDLDKAIPRTGQKRMYIPEANNECQMVEADSLEEAGVALAHNLRARGLI